MKLPIILMMLCIAAWVVMAAGATPSISPASTTPQTQSTTSSTITANPSPTLFQYLLWIVSPTIRLVVGNMVMQPDAILGSGSSSWIRGLTTPNSTITTRRAGGSPGSTTDRPKPHTQSSERAVPSIPDG